MPTNWRIKPSPWLDAEVERMARKENRTTSAMLVILVKEAVDHRLSRSNEVERLIHALTAPADATS